MFNIFKICLDCVWKVCSRRFGKEKTRQSVSSLTTLKVTKTPILDKKKFNRLLKEANKKELNVAKQIIEDNKKTVLAKNEKLVSREKEINALLNLFNPRFY